MMFPHFNSFATDNDCPLPFPTIRAQQLADPALCNKANTHPNLYKWIPFGDNVLLCLCHANTNVCRICIPTSMLSSLIEWHHTKLGHVGASRLQDTISTHLYHPDLRSSVLKIVNKCSDCQQYKLPGRAFLHT